MPSPDAFVSLAIGRTVEFEAEPSLDGPYAHHEEHARTSLLTGFLQAAMGTRRPHAPQIGGYMHPVIKHVWTSEELARQGIRSIEDFTAEELARLHQKVESWIRERAPHPGRLRRRPWVMTKPRTDNPA